MKLNRTCAMAFLAGILAYGILIAGQNPTDAPSKTISETDCTADRIGSSIPIDAIGEPVAGVTLNPLPECQRWKPGSRLLD